VKQKLCFLGWDRSVAKLVAQRLSQGWTEGPLDLSDLLVIVPTQRSGRRLSAHLAAKAAERGTAVLSPTIWTPDLLLSSTGKGDTVAGRFEAVAVLAKLLERGAAASHPEVFGAATADPVPHFFISAAEKLVQLREALGENGLLVRDVAEKLGGVDSGERWLALAEIEAMLLALLEQLHVEDRTLARLRAATAPEMPAGTRRVVVAAVADPAPLALCALAVLSDSVPVDVYVHAPEELRALFDEWGRPIPAEWKRRTIDVPEPIIRLVGKPSDQAREVVSLCAELGLPPRDLALGVPDPEVLPYLERIPHLNAHDPAGAPLSSHPLARVLFLFADLCVEPTFSRFALLVRQNAVLDLLALNIEGFDAAAFLAKLDEVQNEHLPEDMRRLAQCAGSGHVRQACELVGGLCEAFQEKPPAQAIPDFLERLYAGRTLDTGKRNDRDFIAAARALREVVARFDADVFRRCELQRADMLMLIRKAVSSARYYPEREAFGIEAQGWLELPWEDAPHLVITGMNDGAVPEALVSDIFLPDSARTRVGLRDNDARFGRDVYLLAAILASRKGRGSVHLVVGKTSGAGDPVRPSRLLFLCPDNELALRTRVLFGDPRSAIHPVPRTPVWKLEPPPWTLPSRLGVTALAAYLACPFRFYLSHVLGMGPADDRKTELDALDFGAACHHALEGLASEEAADVTDEARLAALLVDRVRRYFTDRFGRRLPATLLIQLDTATSRLAAAARVEAGQRMLGWRTVAVEKRIESGAGQLIVETPGGSIESPITITGRVDRIDVHRDGRVRILDYKTSDKARSPEQDHVDRCKGEAREYALITRGAKPRCFVGLQLPLYRLLLKDEWPGRVECGYFNLPKATGEADIVTWGGMDDGMVEAAKRCTEGILSDIVNGRFWPPSRSVREDDFDRLFFAPVEDSVDPKHLLTRGPA